MKYIYKKLLNLESYKGSFVGLRPAMYKNQWGVHLDGYWERKDGSEGGVLQLWANTEENQLEVLEFDGAYDLPLYVKDELKAIGVICDW